MEAKIDQLHRLADAAGLSRQWRDVDGRDRTVADDTLRQVLAALGHPAETAAEVARGLDQFAEAALRPPALVVGEAGQPLALPCPDGAAELFDETGKAHDLRISGGEMPAIDRPGYYRLVSGGAELRLAIAPAPSRPGHHAHPHRRWGPVIQIPSLRGADGAAFGDFGHLGDAVARFARCGADFAAISPVHALYPGTGDDFSPYSPSSRRFLNGALADPLLAGLPPLGDDAAPGPIDWSNALPRRLAALRRLFNGLSPDHRGRIAADCTAGGDALRHHALFDALDCHFRPNGANGWTDWPLSLRDPASPAVADFARDQHEEVAFHAFVQWLARTGLEQVQARARKDGMALGLIADLAVGVRPAGSDAWAMPEAMLRGLTIGAPPDPLGPLGQNWGLTTCSPRGLADLGYAPWIDMLRAALAHSGGVRIDHAFGLARLWVIPDGCAPGDGAYLSYPFADLVRLAALEAHRAGAIVIAEDLGTAPPGFAQAIAERDMLGMRVLWFQRAADHGFIGAHDYPEAAVAMTGTHDTCTVAGWWRGRDLDWADRLGRLPTDVPLAKAREIREWDRGLLWSTIGGGAERPAPSDPAPVVDRAIAHVAQTPAQLVAVPLEDLAGLEDQVNLPGTVGEHPNWRQRLPEPVSALLDRDHVRRRIGSLNAHVHSHNHDGQNGA